MNTIRVEELREPNAMTQHDMVVESRAHNTSTQHKLMRWLGNSEHPSQTQICLAIRSRHKDCVLLDQHTRILYYCIHAQWILYD